ncbi:MAG: hypothetical protein BWY63_02537 [Chloroflexi bacterium ADurb.Bin360]|nr:MAG: hypothetical protein BWY63_02537 [Chloroflexi bacterium ADurb.Bin360]
MRIGTLIGKPPHLLQPGAQPLQNLRTPAGSQACHGSAKPGNLPYGCGFRNDFRMIAKSDDCQAIMLQQHLKQIRDRQFDITDTRSLHRSTTINDQRQIQREPLFQIRHARMQIKKRIKHLWRIQRYQLCRAQRERALQRHFPT